MERPSEMQEDEYAEVLEGVPHNDEPFIKKYLLGRDALIAQEEKQRSDFNFKQSLSPLAKEACKIVDRIRGEELRTVWTPEYEDALAQERGINVHPGMMFTLAKKRMEQTKLWKILKRLPKGCLLHAHLDAMVDLDFLGETLLETKGMCLYSSEPLSSQTALDNAQIRFKFVRPGKEKTSSAWDSQYKPNDHIPVLQAAESFPHGGRRGFLAWLKDRCTITQSESLEFHHGIDHIWAKFASIFGILGCFFGYEPIFRASIRRLLQQLLADGVKWVELRIAFPFFYHRDGNDTPEKGHQEWFQALQDEIRHFKKSEEGKAFWGARVIWCGIRASEKRLIIEDMDSCIATKLAFPDLLAGYDLVGQEDGGRSLKDLLPELFWFRKQCAQEGLDIPFFFHAGETLGTGNEADRNLFDSLLLGTRRIGHGFSLFKHPLLIDMVKEKRVLIESCPISNEVLRLCASVMSHPLPALLARGIPCCLSSDDPAILGQDAAGTTHDFWQALQGWEGLGLAGLGSLAENSVRWAAFEDEASAVWLHGIQEASLGDGIKAKRLQQWSVEWEQFCLWIVTELSEDGKSMQKIMESSSFDAQD